MNIKHVYIYTHHKSPVPWDIVQRRQGALHFCVNPYMQLLRDPPTKREFNPLYTNSRILVVGEWWLFNSEGDDSNPCGGMFSTWFSSKTHAMENDDETRTS